MERNGSGAHAGHCKDSGEGGGRKTRGSPIALAQKRLRTVTVAEGHVAHKRRRQAT